MERWFLRATKWQDRCKLLQIYFLWSRFQFQRGTWRRWYGSLHRQYPWVLWELWCWRGSVHLDWLRRSRQKWRTLPHCRYSQRHGGSRNHDGWPLPPEAISAETFASLRSMFPMDKSAIPSISLTLVTQCPNSHMIGKWTTSPSMRKIGKNGCHQKKMMRRKNKTPKTKNPRCLHIINLSSG